MKAKILVVDDDTNLRKTLAGILKARGYETAVAANGFDAIAAAERETFSLVLIDLMLPDMHGLEVLTRIKAISPLTEAIILTGHASLDTAIEANRRGAFCYLLKPYRMDELLGNISHAVERRQAQQEIIRLAAFPRLNPNPVIELDPTGAVTYLNPAAERLFPELVAMGQSHPLLHESMALITALRQGEQQGEVVRESRVGEEIYELHISCTREVGIIIIYALDITKRKRAEKALQISEQRHRLLFESSRDALMLLAPPSWKFTGANQATLQLFGVPGVAEFTALGPLDVSPRLQPDGCPSSERAQEMIAIAMREGSNFFEWEHQRQDGRTFSANVLLTRMEVGEELFLLATVRDISELKLAEKEIYLLATTDSLTGITNRREFLAVLKRETARARRYGVPLSLAMYDLDYFKRVNDSFGHDVGDHVLQAVTALVKENIRTTDVVARWGGEEFMVLMPQSDMTSARNATGKLRLAIAEHSFDKVNKLTVSIGVAVFEPQDDVNSFLKRVDDALYRAKEYGRNRVEVLSGEVALANEPSCHRPSGR